MALIKCSNLSLGYEGNIVIKNLSFTVNAGDYLCIVGENGSGKSTLLKGLLKVKAPVAGYVVYNEEINNKIGFLPQLREYSADFPASVYEIVISGRLNSMKQRPFYNKSDKMAVKDAMKLLDIADIKNCRFSDLSGGQKQRVLLARALCAAKSVLLLDEPTAGLDPMITKDFYNLIDRLNKEQNITIIMVSHDIEASVKYANKILHLGDDDTFFGSKEEYMDDAIGRRFLKGSNI